MTQMKEAVVQLDCPTISHCPSLPSEGSLSTAARPLPSLGGSHIPNPTRHTTLSQSLNIC